MTAESEKKLRTLAYNDPVMWQLLAAYEHNKEAFTSWEDFLVNCVLTMAEVKNALHKQLEEHYKVQTPPLYISKP